MDSHGATVVDIPICDASRYHGPCSSLVTNHRNRGLGMYDIGPHSLSDNVTLSCGLCWLGGCVRCSSHSLSYDQTPEDLVQDSKPDLCIDTCSISGVRCAMRHMLVVVKLWLGAVTPFWDRFRPYLPAGMNRNCKQLIGNRLKCESVRAGVGAAVQL